jgi:hypothetical protein
MSQTKGRRLGGGRWHGHRIALAGLALLLSLSPAPASLAGTLPQLVPHRASYELSRHHASTDMDVEGLGGRMEVRFEISCDGFGVEQVIGYRLYDTEGRHFQHVAWLSGWESADGREYVFSTRSWDDGETASEVSGIARMDVTGQRGAVGYARPVEESRPLPPGTVFPTRHVVALLEAARRGERHLRRPVFDGSTTESPFEVSTFFGPVRVAGEDAPAALRGQRHWHLRLAYFPLGSPEPEPSFEMSADLYENGVVGNLLYDYGALLMDVRLVDLEILPAPQCGS